LTYELAFAEGSRNQSDNALRSLAGTVAPAIPTLGELTLNRFAATGAKPGLFYRL